MEPTSPTGPAWVRQRDGSLEPFDADRICRVLFNAGSNLGRADAFLARELTDGVVHFLHEEHADGTPTADEVREVVVKVVRELGQPHLARAFEEATTPEGPRDPESVGPGGFSPELLSAHEDGLLVLGGLDAPAKLAARVLTWPRSADELEAALSRLHAVVAETVVLDGPEHWLALVEQPPEALLTRLASSLRRTGLRAVLNLNIPTPPAAIEALAPGPLFRGSADDRRPAELARLLVEAALARPLAPWRLFWHLNPETTPKPGLGSRVECVLDRPRRGLRLAEGIERDEPALLLRVGVRLSRLPEGESSLDKVGTLARLALSAGVQKRAYLRRMGGDLAEGFLLDRARLQVVPLGLDAFVESVQRRLVQRLRDVLREEGRRVQLGTCLDDAPPETPPFPDENPFFTDVS